MLGWRILQGFQSLFHFLKKRCFHRLLREYPTDSLALLKMLGWRILQGFQSLFHFLALLKMLGWRILQGLSLIHIFYRKLWYDRITNRYQEVLWRVKFHGGSRDGNKRYDLSLIHIFRSRRCQGHRLDLFADAGIKQRLPQLDQDRCYQHTHC